MRHEILRLENVSAIPSARNPLRHIWLNVYREEIVCVYGLRGSGRKSLARIIAGETPIEAGHIYLHEQPVVYSERARSYTGVYHITERLPLLPNLSVAENLHIPSASPHASRHWINWRAIRTQATAVLNEFQLNIDPNVQVQQLSFLEQLRIALIKAYLSHASVIVIDPVEDHLNTGEMADVYHLLYQLRSRGISFVLFCSSETSLKKCDRVLLLQQGSIIWSMPPDEVSEQSIAACLYPHPIRFTAPESTAAKPILMDIQLRSAAIRSFQLHLHAGEITGILYHQNDCANELIDILRGGRTAYRGTMNLDGRRYRIHTISQATRRGVLFAEAPFVEQNLFENLSLFDNVAISFWHRTSVASFINPFIKRYLTCQICQELDIRNRTANLHKPITELGLSASQLQQLYLSRLSHASIRLLVCRNPFVFLYPSFRKQFLDILQQKASEGSAVLVLGNDLSHLQFCHSLYRFDNQRILVPY